jgi:hypothetical protein
MFLYEIQEYLRGLPEFREGDRITATGGHYIGTEYHTTYGVFAPEEDDIEALLEVERYRQEIIAQAGDDEPKSSNAVRHNDGKVDLTYIPIDAQEAEARVWMAGAKKYSRGNWEKLWGEDTVNVVLASLLRHVAAIQKGEARDPETGELHAAHIRCNSAMLIRYFISSDR